MRIKELMDKTKTGYAQKGNIWCDVGTGTAPFCCGRAMPFISTGILGRLAVSLHCNPSGIPQTQAVVLQLGLHPIFQRLNRLSDNKVFNKGREVAGDLRERWETSDSPLVQRIQASSPLFFMKQLHQLLECHLTHQ